MPQLKKEAAPEPKLSTFSPPGVQAELDYWERLIFSFDMDKDPSNPGANPNPRSTRGSRPPRQGSSATPTAPPHNDPSQVLTPLSRAGAH